MAGKTRRRYRALNGLNYGPLDRRVEACDCRKPKPADCEHVIDDLPAESVGWLLAGGHIELVKGEG